MMFEYFVKVGFLAIAIYLKKTSPKMCSNCDRGFRGQCMNPCLPFYPPPTLPVPAVTPPNPLGPTALIGTDNAHYCLPDHVHPLPLIMSPFTPTPGPIVVGDTTQEALEKLVSDTPAPSVLDPLALGVADPGLALPYSREDHVHPLPLIVAPFVPAAGVVAVGDTTQQAIEKLAVGGGPSPSVLDPLSLGPVAPGVALPYSREDHVHPLPLILAPFTPAAGVVAVGDSTQVAFEKMVGNAPPPSALAALALGTAAAGISLSYAREDHVHPLPLIAAPYAPLAGTVVVGDSTQDAIEKIVGNIPPPGAAVPQALGLPIAGVSLDYSRDDHVHPLPLLAAPYTAGAGVVAVGDSTQEAIEKLDGNIGALLGTPVSLGTFNLDSNGGTDELLAGVSLINGNMVTLTINHPITSFVSGAAASLTMTNPGPLPFVGTGGSAILHGTLLSNSGFNSVIMVQPYGIGYFTLYASDTGLPIINTTLTIPGHLSVSGTYASV